MADAALAMQSHNAANASRVERSSARGPVKPVRPVPEVGSFQRNVNASASLANSSSRALKQEQPSGSGLLSTGAQMLLAETRTQEAGATFVPISNVGRALDSYKFTQAKVRNTIRENLAFGKTDGSSEQAQSQTSLEAPKPSSASGGAGSVQQITNATV